MGIKNVAKISFKPSINQNKCNVCEDCIEACTAEVFTKKHGKVIVLNSDACQGCESCINVCRKGAITIEDTSAELSDTCHSLLKDIL